MNGEVKNGKVMNGKVMNGKENGRKGEWMESEENFGEKEAFVCVHDKNVVILQAEWVNTGKTYRS